MDLVPIGRMDFINDSAAEPQCRAALAESRFLGELRSPVRPQRERSYTATASFSKRPADTVTKISWRPVQYRAPTP